MEWGCTEELWKKTKNKKGLKDLLRKGQHEKGRARIARLREIVDDDLDV